MRNCQGTSNVHPTSINLDSLNIAARRSSNQPCLLIKLCNDSGHDKRKDPPHRGISYDTSLHAASGNIVSAGHVDERGKVSQSVGNSKLGSHNLFLGKSTNANVATNEFGGIAQLMSPPSTNLEDKLQQRVFFNAPTLSRQAQDVVTPKEERESVLTNIAPMVSPVKRQLLSRTKSQTDMSENLDQIWNDHIVNKKPILAKGRKLRLGPAQIIKPELQQQQSEQSSQQ